MTERIKALIIDDEKNSREVLSKLLEKWHPEIEVIGEASNVEEAYTLCVNLKPQLVFLDIQMPKANGFNLLRMFNEIPFEIIFVTSYDQYAITAINFNALAYLLKPIELEELKIGILKSIKNIESKVNVQPLIINLIHSLESKSDNKRIAAHLGEKVKIINTNEVVLIKGDGRYCHLSLKTGELITMAKNLKDFEYYFGEKSSFVRISKTYMLNADYIKEYIKGDPFMIRMINDKIFEVSRRKKTEVLEKLRIIK